jgi:hypothetical protein
MVSNRDIRVYGLQREAIEADLIAEIVLLFEREQADCDADNGSRLSGFEERPAALKEQD